MGEQNKPFLLLAGQESQDLCATSHGGTGVSLTGISK
jgi:hypothetical protein